ncbi:MAG: hypothetical protein H8D23_36155, partial [Candidatus Brocadiales bacterium]|nr:hypothetical protein [Candidatus Brocadiales bacterium]
MKTDRLKIKVTLLILLVVFLGFQHISFASEGHLHEGHSPEGNFHEDHHDSVRKYIFIDDTNFSLHFDNLPKRIISVSPGTTEIIGVIGADSMLVGVSLYSYYPPSVKGLPKVGSYV